VTHRTLLLWGIAHAFYLVAAWLVLTGRARTAAGLLGRLTTGRAALLMIVAVGLLPRLALLGTPPSLSEDLYRYLWDGRLVAYGINPYALAPADPALAGFQDDLFRRLNHPAVPTVYPPAAQLFFAGAAALGATPLAWKTVLFVLEAALLAALISLLGRRGLPPERLLLYYWNPLVIVECYGNGHLDLAVAALLLVAFSLQETGRRVPAGVAFGTAMITKWIPVLLVPVLIRRRAWGLLAAAALLVTISYAPFFHAGPRLWEGLRVYARHWEFNGPLYALLRPLFQTGDPPRLILAGCLALATLATAWRARSLTGAALATWTAFLLFSPTVYPWYLVPAIALLPLHPSAGLLLFSGTVALVYAPLAAYRATGMWRVPGWIMAAEYGAWILVWMLGALRAVHHREQADVEESDQVEKKERERREEPRLGEREHDPREVEAQ
jgi:hypothetical protein